MDLDKYLKEYNNVSREELEKIKVWANSELAWFEAKIRSLHKAREMEKRYGRPALLSGPLVHVLSVSVQPKNDNEDKPLAIYGRINAEFYDSGGMVVHELYKRDRNVAEILGTSSTLTLIGPEDSCRSRHACIPLFRSRINVLLFDGADNVFAKKCFYFDDTEIEDGYEQVKSKFIRCEHGSLTVQYIVIPFGVNCRIKVMIQNRKDFEKHDFVNVYGKIAVRYANTYGNYFSEECVLFEKQYNEFERVEIGNVKYLQLSRCWVALPAYSSLVVGVDLSEFETRRKIVNDTIELAEPELASSSSFMSDDFFIRVNVAWFSPNPLGPCSVDGDYHCSPSLLGIPTEEIEEMDTEGEAESSDDESDDALSSNLNIPWHLRPHKSKPWPSPAVEIFSVFIGREKSKAVQIYGSIEVLSNDYGICYIFKRDEKNVLGLSEHMKSVLDSVRAI